MLNFNAGNTFCITLDKRRESIIRKCSAIGLNITIVDAVTPDKLDKSLNFWNYLNETNRACSQSHFNLWQKIVNEKIPYAMIIEDDACFVRDFFAKLSTFPPNTMFDLILLNCSEPITTLNEWVKVCEQYLAGGYILSYNGAKLLTESYSNLLATTDWMTSRLQNCGRSYAYFPWLIIQEGISSTIGSNVEADHEKVLRCLNAINYDINNYLF